MSAASKSKAAHDFKTPLTAIQMMLHLLNEQKVGSLNATQSKMVTQAVSDCDRLATIIQEYFRESPESPLREEDDPLK